MTLLHGGLDDGVIDATPQHPELMSWAFRPIGPVLDWQ